jgi:hypothetical protein
MEIGAPASAIFGAAATTDVFSVNAPAETSPAQQAAQSTIEAHKREINRIRGYKLQLSVAEKQQLAKLQVEIQEIDQRVAQGLARPDELDTRLDLFADADRIIGKPIVDAEGDETLAELGGALEALLQPKLNKQIAQQVERLERVQATLEERVAENPSNRTALQQFQSINRAIANLKPLREVKELSKAETRAYNEAVEAINDHVGIKIELTAKEAVRVAELESSIASLQALVPPDIASQPTPAQVARAYVRLS